MRLDEAALAQLFVAARTHRAWLPREVPDSTLRELVGLAEMGPTANNGLPARFLFVKSPTAVATPEPGQSRQDHAGAGDRHHRL